MDPDIPEPYEGERPTEYSDRLGGIYASGNHKEHQKGLGQFFTPIAAADFMGRLLTPRSGVVEILDPGAGTGILSVAACEALAAYKVKPTEIRLTAFEVDARLLPQLERSCSFARDWLKEHSIRFTFRIESDDFVLQTANALTSQQQLFADAEGSKKKRYDIVVCNPPYFKISKSDPRAKAASNVVYGQPNIYSLFMAASAYSLKSQGELVFITPRSYAAGLYFRRFRQVFFSRMRPERIHLFVSRRDAFQRDDVLQENLILKATSSPNWWTSSSNDTVDVSFSTGIRDIDECETRAVQLSLMIDMDSKERTLRIPISDTDESVLELVDTWPGSLASFGLEISTGPIIPFRSRQWLANDGELGKTHAPVLWMQNVSADGIVWPVATGRKEQYFAINEESLGLLVKDGNYTILRRFSSKEETRRLISAPLLKGFLRSEWIGLENHLNYIHRPGGNLRRDDAFGLAAIYNSSLVDAYFRTVSGNTQVNATEIRAMPLPPLETIWQIGACVRDGNTQEPLLDSWITKLLTSGTQRVPSMLC